MRFNLFLLACSATLVALGAVAHSAPAFWLGTFILGSVVLDIAFNLIEWLYETRPVAHRSASLSLLDRDKERIGWEHSRRAQ